MKIDREKDNCFYLTFVYVFISHSANKGISIESLRKIIQKQIE